MPDRLLFMMSKIHTRVSSYIKAELKSRGVALSPGQMGILLALEKERLTTMGVLSSLLDIDNAAMSRLVDKLEKLSLVERRINPADRRQMLISITGHGLEKAAVVKAVAKSANTRITEGFTDAEMEIYRRVNLTILEKFR